MGRYPIDIMGNYGMQTALSRPELQDIEIVSNVTLPCDRESVERRVTMLRQKYGFTEFAGENVEYHASGAVTFPILGTKAKQEDKLAFDPDRSKRRAIYEDVKAVFSDYIVFVGGSSSFDMTPAPYNKAYALSQYCAEHGINHDEVVYVGDDYGPGGNDESVYKADFNYIEIDNYLDFPKLMEQLL
jgi:hydroxymethylpyrimidine pyrophosphatase-like HAD family hydrolase